MDHSPEQRILRLLRDTRNTLAVAESCTGGMIGSRLTDVAGMSQVFLGGVICYDNAVKERVLGVAPALLREHGAVSGQCVSAMAEGACRLIGATCAIAVSGIAGPGGGTAEKPVGLVWIGVQARGGCRAFRHVFEGERRQVREQAVTAALTHLLEFLQSP